MRQLLKTLALVAVIAASAVGARAEESRRGFYEGTLTGGGRIVFFVQANHSISSYIFDKAGQQASFAGGPIADNKTFNLTTSANQTLTGSVGTNTVTATFLGQTVTATLASVFGPSGDISGRFTAAAESNTGVSLDVKIVIDAQNNIFLVTKQGSTVLGGFGTVSVTPAPSPSPSPSPSPGPSASPSPSPSPSASPSPSPSPSPSASPSPSPNGAALSREDEPGDDHGHSGRGRHGSEDDDEAEDHHEDENRASFNATFTVNFVTGQVVTGHLVFSHGTLLGDFTFNGVVFNFRAPQQSIANHLANISTRGFVNTGQGQLISGFIITGGPKIVVLRAIGPSLANRGVHPALANPVLQLFSGNTIVRENDNWQSAANANDVIASGVAPESPLESAILIRLEPGEYTTVVTGSGGGTGIALVEVYEVARD
jgi:hypothetical protein